jgi:hypothetical protein
MGAFPRLRGKWERLLSVGKTKWLWWWGWGLWLWFLWEVQGRATTIAEALIDIPLIPRACLIETFRPRR